MIATVHEMLLRGMRGYPVEPTEADLAMLTEKVTKSVPSDLAGFCFVTGRNWAITQLRRRSAALRKLEQKVVEGRQAAEARERAEERAKFFEQARCEFFAIMPELSRSAQRSRPQQIKLVQLRLFDKVSDAQAAEILEGTNREQRDKWLQRGRRLVAEKAPPTLRAYLGLSLWKVLA